MTTHSVMHEVMVVLPVILELIALMVGVLLDQQVGREKRRIIFWIVVLVYSLVAQNVIEHVLMIGEPRPMLRTAVSVYGYCVRPVILLLFCHLVRPNDKHLAGWILVGLNTMIHCTAFFSSICFYITPENHYGGGPLSDTCLYVSALLLINLLCMSIWWTRHERKREILIPIIVTAMIVISVVADSLWDDMEEPITFLTTAIVWSSFLFYIWLRRQFYRMYEHALQAEQQIEIMMSQIQPHFLFNTLSTIQALCRIDPDKASLVTEKFGSYLRQNIESLTQQSMIPLQKELEHTRTYADIEMIRFPNIRVEYDIRDDGFSLPALTIQPLVENAIRHGIRGKKNGVVQITSERTAEGHLIVIRDNGKGFDSKKMDDTEEEGLHIGLRVVRDRIQKLTGGTLTVKSEIGKGAIVEIRVPNAQVQDGRRRR